MLKFNVFGKTDVGKRRNNNEDAFIAQTVWDDNHLLAVVIDGVGGYEGGEVAAEIAQETILEYLQEYSNGERLSLLTQAVTQANNSIYEQRHIRNGYEQMGCVLTAVLFDLENGQLNMAHIGDTRLYCFQNNVLTKISHDHSEVGYQEETGALTEEEAMHHPQRNIINRIVGAEMHKIDDLEFIDSTIIPIIYNSTYLLCSDGLCDMLTSNEISSILQKDISIEIKVQELIDFANEKGGKDNITVVLVEFKGKLPVIQENKVIENTEINNDKLINPPNNKKNKFLKIFGFITLAFVFGVAGGWFGQKCFHYENVSKKIVPIIDSIKTQSVDSLDINKIKDTLKIHTLTE